MMVTMPGLYDYWKQFVLEVMDKPEIVVISAHQRIHRDLELTIPGGNFLVPLEPETVQYKKNKVSQLTRHYFNQASIERARSDVFDRVMERKYGSGVFVFRNKLKTGTRQDFCIASGVLSFYPKEGLFLTVHYRTTEILHRLTGDLIFLQQVVLPYLTQDIDIPLARVKLKFDNLTFHPMFCPKLLIHWKPVWEVLFKHIKRENPTLHEALLYFLWRYYFDPRDTFKNYATGDRIRNQLYEYFPECLPQLKVYVDANYDSTVFRRKPRLAKAGQRALAAE